MTETSAAPIDVKSERYCTVPAASSEMGIPQHKIRRAIRLGVNPHLRDDRLPSICAARRHPQSDVDNLSLLSFNQLFALYPVSLGWRSYAQGTTTMSILIDDADELNPDVLKIIKAMKRPSYSVGSTEMLLTIDEASTRMRLDVPLIVEAANLSMIPVYSTTCGQKFLYPPDLRRFLRFHGITPRF